MYAVMRISIDVLRQQGSIYNGQIDLSTLTDVQLLDVLRVYQEAYGPNKGLEYVQEEVTRRNLL